MAMVMISTGCLHNNSPQRRYYVLQTDAAGTTVEQQPAQASINGLVRVRDLDADSTYDNLQIVVRHSPFELTYQERNVWAVKPHRMISDEIARSLLSANVFSGVIRELAERRPNYLLSGDLHAIEIYDANMKWNVHLALSLNLSRFDTGEVLWNFHFDERKEVNLREFSYAVRGLSELLTQAIDQAKASLQESAANQPKVFAPPATAPTRTRN